MEQLTRFEYGGDVYELKYRTCGKQQCKCRQGELHGPYWFRNNVEYVGKSLPAPLVKVLSLRQKEKPRLEKMMNDRRKQIAKLRLTLDHLDNENRTISGIARGGEFDSSVARKIGLSAHVVEV